ncbi:MAG: phospholipid carrier-dependent glycosyltransferase [Candidatus Peregrinibacteria bacterium]|nr:phospholipid carrier-dependent glycosyltransferase [Candidatus Peregrinibacteria bacterium]MDZ4245214.1 phospholipid carrier-dependent glycosyltransferase [Candidatus Gracilibacteria bacterium]
MEFIKKVSNLKNRQVFIILFALGMIAYLNVMNGEFIWDDVILITKNEHVHSLSYIFTLFKESTLEGVGVEGNLYRPLVNMIFAIIYAFFGENEIAYHAFNILLHIGNAFLVFILLERLSFKRFGSLLAASIFLLHPIQTESVSYIAGLPDVLNPFFILLGLVIFAGEDDKPLNAKTKILVVIFTILALLSKETGIIFPALAGLILFYKWDHLSQQKKSSMLQMIATMTLVTILYIILRMTILNFTGSFDLNSGISVYTGNFMFRVYTFFAAIFEYAKLIFYPANLHFEKAFEVFAYLAKKPALGLGIILASSSLAVFSYYKKRHFFFFYVWFVITIALVSGVFLPSNATYKEHWLYMPLIGFVFLIPSIWEKLKSDLSKQIFLTTFLIISILLISQTIHRNTEWKDKLTFFETEIKYNQTSSRLQDRLGLYYFENKEYEKSVEYFKKGIELDKDGRIPYIRTNLANSYLAMRDLDAAVNEYFTVLESHPNSFDAHVALYNIAIAIHNKEMEDAFFEFLQRIEAGGTVDFETEILPWANTQ